MVQDGGVPYSVVYSRGEERVCRVGVALGGRGLYVV